MLNWLKILSILVFMLLALPKKSVVSRGLASTNSISCMQAFKSFGNNKIISQTKYDSYLSAFKNSSVELNLKSFENVEHYLAWLDYKFDHNHVSLGKYLINSSTQKKRILSFLVNRSRPDKKLGFLFDDIFEYIVFKSIDLKGITGVHKFALKEEIRTRLAKEALKAIEEEPTSKFAKFMKSRGVRGVLNVAGLLPVLTPPHLPVWLPKIRITDAEKLLDSAKSIDEMKRVFYSLHDEDRHFLALSKGYEKFRRYYLGAIVVFYNIYLIHEYYDIHQSVEEISDMNEILDDTISELEAIEGADCSTLDYCLDEFKSEWEGQGEEVYLEWKTACKEMYDIPKECE